MLCGCDTVAVTELWALLRFQTPPWKTGLHLELPFWNSTGVLQYGLMESWKLGWISVPGQL